MPTFFVQVPRLNRRRKRWLVPSKVAAITACTPIAVCTASAVTIYGDGTNGSTAGSGGQNPVTYQWYRSTTSDFTPGGGNIISGATNQNYTVASPDTTLYFYKRKDTDGAAQAATSVEAPGRLLDANIRVLFIGDSLYYNTPTSGSPPPTHFGNFAVYLGGRIHTVTIFNAGAAGSATTYWLPSTDPAYTAWPDPGPPDTGGLGLLAWAKTQLAVSGTTFVVIRLGANDAVTGISAATYGARMSTIISNLTTAGYTVILNYPTYGRPAGSYGGSVNARVQQYHSQIDSLVNGSTIYAGDKKQFDASAILSGWRQDDIHPSVEGARELALADILAVANSLYPSSGGSAIFFPVGGNFVRGRA